MKMPYSSILVVQESPESQMQRESRGETGMTEKRTTMTEKRTTWNAQSFHTTSDS